MKRSFAFSAVAFLAALAGGASALADPPTERRRAEIEDAYLEERYEPADLSRPLPAAEAEPYALWTLYWRPARPPPAPQVAGTPTPLAASRVQWFARPSGPYPVPRAGESDPYPVLTALVLERVRREASGARGLPEESPLAALADPAVDRFLERIMRPALFGPDPANRTEEEKDLAARVRDVASRNRVVAIGAVLVLLVLAGAWTFASRSRRAAGGGGG